MTPPTPRQQIRATRQAASPSTQAKQPLTDISAYPVLTEEVGYPPSPLARAPGLPSGGGAGGSLGQIVSKAVGDVLGWKGKPGDAKGFLGALTQAFTLTEVNGHVESKLVQRTYALQTDLSGGISGAQASVYARGKEAIDQSQPLLDGLYPLDPEADAEDVAALKAVAKSQLTELATELGVVPPRITRVNQYFSLLIGAAFPAPPIQGSSLTATDPDQVGGTLGTLRDELGLNFTTQDFVNSLEDEQDLSNFRIISDYLTSLAQTWLNNLGFLGLNTTTPFFGTWLVLLSRQLSVVSESVDEVRFTLDSVFIGPAERQTMQLNFATATTPIAPIFLEDLLTWIQGFASEEGPRLIRDGGKFGVQNTFYPVANNLSVIVANVLPQNPTGLPPGFYTPRVQLSLTDLQDQLTALAQLAKPIEHVITPEPDFGLPFAVNEMQPNSFSKSSLPQQAFIRGSGFYFSGTAIPSVQYRLGTGSWTPALLVYFRSESLLVMTIPSGLTPGTYDIQVENPGSSTWFQLIGAFTVTTP